jgi:hypothetical protein
MRRPHAERTYDSDALLAAAQVVEEQRIASSGMQPEPDAGRLLARARLWLRSLSPSKPAARALLADATADDCAAAFLALLADELATAESARMDAEIAASALQDRVFHADDDLSHTSLPATTLRHYTSAARADVERLHKEQTVSSPFVPEPDCSVFERGASAEFTLNRLFADRNLRHLRPRYRLADDPDGERFAQVLEAIELSAERFDGSGPHGLEGAQIPEAARLLAVARLLGKTYARTLDLKACRSQIEGKAATVLDPAICQAAISVLEREQSALDGEGRSLLYAIERPPLARRATDWLSQFARSGG